MNSDFAARTAQGRTVIPDELIVALGQHHSGNVLAFARAIAREAVNNAQDIEDAREPDPSPQIPLTL